MNGLLRFASDAIARYLSRPIPAYHPLATSSFADLDANLRAGDVLLVEGDTRISGAIKYLTQSTWSHAALCLGRGPFGECCPGENALIEATSWKAFASCLRRATPIATRASAGPSASRPPT